MVILLVACREDGGPSSKMKAAEQLPAPPKKPDPNQVIVPEGESLDTMDFTLLQVVKLYEEFSGKRVLIAREIEETEMTFTMREPLTNGEAGRYLQLILLGEGIAMIPIPDEEGIVRLVAAEPIISYNNAKPFCSDESELPERDELVMFQMIFRNLDLEEALVVF